MTNKYEAEIEKRFLYAGKGVHGKKDVYTNPYFANRERLAELINVHLYQGNAVVIPQNLQRLGGEYPSLGSVSGKKQRDLFFEDDSTKIRYGLELESKEDYSMPERIMVYDASDYEEQIRLLDQQHQKNKEYHSYQEKKSRIKKDDELIPVITLVLYLGEGEWNAPKRLCEMYGRDTYKNQMLQDYRIFVIEADNVNVLNYATDLREFFEALQCRKNKKD